MISTEQRSSQSWSKSRLSSATTGQRLAVHHYFYHTYWTVALQTPKLWYICCASEIFQNAILETLGGMPGVLNVSDDILVYGKSPEEHDNNLKQVLSRLREKGLTLNKTECPFSQDNLKYLGYIFSKEGMSPDPDKVSALNDTSVPSNPTEVRSLYWVWQTTASASFPTMRPLLSL